MFEYSSDVHGFFYLFHWWVASNASKSRARCPVSTGPRKARGKPPRRRARSRQAASGWSHAPRPEADPARSTRTAGVTPSGADSRTRRTSCSRAATSRQPTHVRSERRGSGCVTSRHLPSERASKNGRRPVGGHRQSLADSLPSVADSLVRPVTREACTTPQSAAGPAAGGVAGEAAGFEAEESSGASAGRAVTVCSACAGPPSGRMSIFQPVSFAARRAF